MTCQICASGAGTYHQAREMMFGLGHAFSYFECAGCGCVQLASPPPDMSAYYPENYYSFAERRLEHAPALRGSGLRRWLATRRNEAQVLGRGGVWGAVAAARPYPGLRLPDEVRGVSGLRFSSRILDVGCGGGGLLARLADLGFTHLTGADPYLPADKSLGGLVSLRAAPIERIDDGPYDLVMFHHSLEHVSDQWSAIRAAARLLAPRGTCLVRIPTATSAVWEKYRSDWVELDPPRHYVLHTHTSLKLLADGCGLRVTHLSCDEDGLGYWGSELYRRGLTLFDALKGSFRRPDDFFTQEEVLRFREQAASDNSTLRGGRLIAHLVPAGGGRSR